MAHEPRKQARQARAKRTQAAIIEAAACILEAEGAAALNTNHVADKAGISIGSLYQYFSNKDAIVAAILRREWAELRENVATAVAQVDTAAAQLDALLEVALDHQFARPRLARELEYLENGLDMDAEVQALAADVAQSMDQVTSGFAVAPEVARDIVTIGRALINAEALKPKPDVENLRVRVRRAVFGYLERAEAAAL